MRHRRRQQLLSAIIVLVGALGVSACSSGNGQSVAPGPAGNATGSGGPPGANPATRPAEQYTPVVMNVLTTPSWFTGSDGRGHLVYELRLINAFPVPVTVQEVKVRDANGGRVITTLSGTDLSASLTLQPLGLPPINNELAPSTVGIVWLDVKLADPSELPPQIDHELTISVPPGLPVPESVISTGAATPVDVRPPTVIAPPLEGPGWVAFGSCCDGPHRRAVQPVNNELWVAQRFAIDFNRINDQRMLATGDQNVNANWPTYDQPVLAVADATVTVSANDRADQVPNSTEPVDLEKADGNYVILELDQGLYAFYAHLKPGSVTVRDGDRVTKGQDIGRTGNSGSSSGPHLHFQLMDHPSALAANGRPYVFDSFAAQGTTPPVEELMQTNPETDPVPIDTATAGPRTNQLPLGRDVCDFPSR